MSAKSGGARSLALLRDRVGRIPDGIARDLARALPPLGSTLSRARRFTATGTGGSEGPAQAFVAALQERGIAARFRPLSSFALDHEREGALVVFSQGMSPNARLALRHAGPDTVLVTALDELGEGPGYEALRAAAGRGALICPHGPSDEHGLLVRIEGPTRATLVGLRLAEVLAPRSAPPVDLPARARRAFDAAAPALGQHAVALVTAGDAGPLAQGLRWKLLEALGIPDPPIWDVLQVAHGPLQQFYDTRATLLAVEGCDEAPLFDRLGAALVRERHELRRLTATLPHPWGWFEHDAQINAVVLATLTRRPRDLIDWPGKGRDGSLYELSAS